MPWSQPVLFNVTKWIWKHASLLYNQCLHFCINITLVWNWPLSLLTCLTFSSWKSFPFSLFVFRLKVLWFDNSKYTKVITKQYGGVNNICHCSAVGLQNNNFARLYIYWNTVGKQTHYKHFYWTKVLCVWRIFIHSFINELRFAPIFAPFLLQFTVCPLDF